MAKRQEKKLDACLNLNRRMPPVDVEDTLDNLISLADDIEDAICQAVDCPLQVGTDTKANQKFITCDYNRDGDSFRSPITNQYFPPFDADDPFMPSATLRPLEEKANVACNLYRELYHQGGVSSVFCWDLADTDNFAACWAVVKDVKKEDLAASSGLQSAKKVDLHWSEIHVFEVTRKTSKWDYKLTSTAIAHVDRIDVTGLALNVSGNRTVQAEKKDVTVTKGTNVQDFHVEIMGSMVESAATQLLNSMSMIYFGKMNEIISYLHQNQKDINKQHAAAMARDLKKKYATAPR